MLSYQHIYHAGNPADIHKHLWLVSVLAYLQQKDKPLTWLDTHGGRGLYDLASPEAQKLQEYQSGLSRLILFLEQQKSTKLPEVLRRYQSLLKTCNPDTTLRYYPGSALIAAHMMRPNDSLHSFDMHPGEVAHLREALWPFPQAHIRKADGYTALKKFLPPPSGRGGALIDPSYEIKSEYADVFEQLKMALKRFPMGTFMIWYPLLPAGHHEALTTSCESLTNEKILIDEWIFADPAQKERGLYGSGMILVNPPYTTPETMREIKNLILPILLETA